MGTLYETKRIYIYITKGVKILRAQQYDKFSMRREAKP